MKKIIMFLFIVSCASKNPDWDSGAQRQQNYSEEQRQEQVDNTNNQMTTPGRSGASQNVPW
ncbi:MAG: hypothetical protein V4598_01170 [Bdellovibrionota bacterium]